MKTMRIAAALAWVGMFGVVGCDGSEGRTTLSCGNENGCLTMQAAEELDLQCTNAPEVKSCPTEGILASCVWVSGAVRYTLLLLAQDVLEEAQARCATNKGTWSTPTDS